MEGGNGKRFLSEMGKIQYKRLKAKRTDGIKSIGP
jgi:hypothetical protein